MTDRHPTPPPGIKGILAQRRGTGGARREISARVTLRAEGAVEYDGWALNISRGGIRVVIEERVQRGQEFFVVGYDPDNPDAEPRRARVVWVQDEPDGAIIGLAFLDVDPDRQRVPGPPPSPGSQTP